ncbi:MAG: OstA-like protein [candidate division BRC1 bacterium ADurb.BinA364]|nr:MAG: OstA-like protein [candidate division BRC1 bacterium ADurb.BinA364]
MIRLRRRARRRRISPRGVHALGLRPAGDSLLRAARFWLLAAALVWAARGAMAAAAPAFGAPGFGGAAGGNDIDLTADVIVFEQVNGQFTSMEANGRVKLLTEGLLVMCDRLLYDPASETMTASVSRSPKVYVETEQQKAECRRLTYHMKTGLFDLEGAAKVSYGEAVLQGDKMRIQSTSEGRFSVVSDSGAVSRSERQSPDAARDAAQAASQLREAFGTSIDIENILYGEGAQPASVTIRQDGSMKQSSSGAATPPPSGAIGPANLNAIPGSSGPKKMEIE